MNGRRKVSVEKRTATTAGRAEATIEKSTAPYGAGRLVAGLTALAVALAVAPAAAGDFDTVFAKQPRGLSFDCSRATLTVTETRICRNATLSKLDLALNDAFAQAAFESNEVLAAAGRETAWLRLRDTCHNDICLVGRYRVRIAQVRAELAREEHSIHDWRHDIMRNAGIEQRLAHDAEVPCFQLQSTLDLGDGHASFLASYVDPALSKSCKAARNFGEAYFANRAMILHPDGDRYHVVFDEPSVYVSGICCFPQNERSHGLHRITTFSRSGAAEHYLDMYDFDGHIYRHVATVDLNEWNLAGHRA